MPKILFATEADGTKPFTFVQLCDTQFGMGGYEHDLKTFKQAVSQINGLNPDFVVICGDLVHDRNEQSFADFNKIKAQLDVPCYCVPGNHDVGNNPTPESLQYYRQVIGEDYYSFEHKGLVFVCVNTQLWKSPLEVETNKHDAWLKDTLQSAANKNASACVVGHYPLFLEKPDEEEKYMNLPKVKRKELLNLFEARGVIAVLGGHTHRLTMNQYKGIQLVNGETTSKNFDKRPLGFRIWSVTDEPPFKHKLVPLEGF
ncbi:MAG: metallophosphoesterase [bacterium]